MAVFTSALTRDAPSTELFGNLRILETIPAPERRIRGARGALSYDAGRVRLLTFWTVPLLEARKTRKQDAGVEIAQEVRPVPK